MVDVVINGGGMVGACTALSLANLGLSVTLIEANSPKSYDSEQPLDLRVSAINLFSEKLLASVGAWNLIKQMRAALFNHLQVWETPDNPTCFDNQQIGQSHLGHIIENRVIQLALWQCISQQKNITLHKGERINDCEQLAEGWRVKLTNEQQIDCSLLIGADGAQSQVRQHLKIGTQGWNYRQSALVLGLNTEFPQQDITWQQMTPTGPKAFLPLAGNNASLVWYDQSERVKQLAQLNFQQLKQQVLDNFPPLAGDFTIYAKASFPLTRMHANNYVGHCAVLMGDAAHTINPLAGQGVNLGFKDVAALTDVLKQGMEKGQSVNCSELLKQYQQQRRFDNQLMMTAMDGVYSIFSNDIGPLKFIRNIGLKIANQATPLKDTALKYATGIF